VDALARISHEALIAGRTVHLFFENLLILTLSPDFLQEWQRSAKESLEDRLKEIFDDAVWRGRSFKGLQRWWPRGSSTKLCIEYVVKGAGEDISYDRVCTLAESGCPVRFVTGSVQGDQSTEMATLYVLGGVRDMTDDEDKSLKQVCEELELPIKNISLGSTPELTSKCINDIETGSRLGHMSEAPACNNSYKRSPLHVIYDTVNQTHGAFARKSEAHWLLVKVFSKSHGRHCDTWLSIIDRDGAVLTVTSDDFRGGLHILHHEDAKRNLSSIIQKKTPLASVMDAQREFENRYCRRGKHWILIVDDEARQFHLPGGRHNSLSAAAVTVAITAPANPLRDQGCLRLRDHPYGKSSIVRASLGGFDGLGFVAMRHSEQQLAHYIEFNSKMPTWKAPSRAPWWRQAASVEQPKAARSDKSYMDHAGADNEQGDVDAETVMSENAETLSESAFTDDCFPVEDKGTITEDDVDSWNLEEVLSRAPWKLPLSSLPNLQYFEEKQLETRSRVCVLEQNRVATFATQNDPQHGGIRWHLSHSVYRTGNVLFCWDCGGYTQHQPSKLLSEPCKGCAKSVILRDGVHPTNSAFLGPVLQVACDQEGDKM
jgi:hypothetical protein